MMTLKEFCKKYNYSQSSVKTKFSRTAQQFKKEHNLALIRRKVNGITYYEVSDNRAMTIYNENKQVLDLNKQLLKLENYQLFILFGIMITPMGVFRGSRKDFLKYIGLPASKKNVDTLDSLLLSLRDKDFIGFDIDGDYIIIYIKRKIEKELQLNLDVIKYCRIIAEKNNKKGDKVIQLIKVWLAIELCMQNQPFVLEQIAKLTGLSLYQVRDVKQMLVADDIFRFSRVGNYYYSKGNYVDENAYIPLIEMDK